MRPIGSPHAAHRADVSEGEDIEPVLIRGESHTEGGGPGIYDQRKADVCYQFLVETGEARENTPSHRRGHVA